MLRLLQTRSNRRYLHALPKQFQLSVDNKATASRLPKVFSPESFRIFQAVHAKAVGNVNQLISQSDDFQKFKDMPLVEILFSITMRSSAASRRNAQTLDLFNAASFAWNNDFYLSTLKSDGKPKDNAGPSPHVMKTFDKNFPVSTEDGQTSLEKFNKEFSQIALNILNKMGAEQTTGGFLWLMYEHGSDSLRIGRTFGSACPLFPRFGAVGTSSSSASSGNAIKYVPVLALSLNEHAYLYKYMSEEQKGAPLQLNAEKYISDFWDSVDWSQVANRMDAKNGLK